MLDRGLSSTTVLHLHRLLKKIFNWAVEEKLLSKAKNPMDTVNAPGYQHMTKLATRLHDLGAKKIGMIDWPDAPNTGDAADAIKAGVDIGELIAKALTQNWQPQRAIEDFDQAIQLDPFNADAYYGRGVCYRKLGNITQADADQAQARSLDTKYC